MENIKLILCDVLARLGLLSLYYLRFKSALLDEGWFRSFEENASLDAEGRPIPWFTYPAIDFIKIHLPSNMTVFEYGCGSGTLWWSNCAKEVVACEHNLDWYNRLSENKPENVEIHHVDLVYGGEYSKIIANYRNIFDVVVIDGRDRVNCAKNCIPSLKTNGVIIFDDSDRIQYQEGYNYLYANGFKKIEFIGMGPGLTFKFETSIFYRVDNVFNI